MFPVGCTPENTLFISSFSNLRAAASQPDAEIHLAVHFLLEFFHDGFFRTGYGHLGYPQSPGDVCL